MHLHWCQNLISAVCYRNLMQNAIEISRLKILQTKQKQQKTEYLSCIDESKFLIFR